MEQVNAVVGGADRGLVAAGIAEEDIQTSGLNLWTTTDDGGEVNGYQASLNVNVTVRDIDAVGSTIDAAQQAAGQGFTIGGVSFSFADPESVLEPGTHRRRRAGPHEGRAVRRRRRRDARRRRQHLRAVVVAAGHLRRR